MHEVIEAVAKKMRLPYWWVKAIAIEYTECRDYATRDEIWTFNFDKLSEYNLEQAVRSHHVVVYGTLIHNVHADVWSSRTIERLVSDIPVKLAEELALKYPELDQMIGFYVKKKREEELERKRIERCFSCFHWDYGGCPKDTEIMRREFTSEDCKFFEDKDDYY